MSENLDGITFQGKPLYALMEEKIRSGEECRKSIEDDEVYPYRNPHYTHRQEKEEHGEIKQMSQKHVNALNYQNNMKKAGSNCRMGIIAILLANPEERFTIKALSEMIETNPSAIKSAMTRLIHKTILGNYIQRQRKTVGVISKYYYWMNNDGLELTWDDALIKSMQLIDNGNDQLKANGKLIMADVEELGEMATPEEVDNEHDDKHEHKEVKFETLGLLKSIEITSSTVGSASTTSVILHF